jgi:PTS system galactitol-specific IIA component
MESTAESIYYDAVILEDMNSKEEIISCLANYLRQKGYVNEQYQAATLERELEYPTGLPTKPIGVAVPHSKAENVIRPAIVMAISRKLVEFGEMGNAGASLQVGIVFMLALQGENRHLNFLKHIINFCKQESNVTRLYQVPAREEAYRIFQEEILPGTRE